MASSPDSLHEHIEVCGAGPEEPHGQLPIFGVVRDVVDDHIAVSRCQTAVETVCRNTSHQIRTSSLLAFNSKMSHLDRTALNAAFFEGITLAAKMQRLVNSNVRQTKETDEQGRQVLRNHFDETTREEWLEHVRSFIEESLAKHDGEKSLPSINGWPDTTTTPPAFPNRCPFSKTPFRQGPFPLRSQRCNQNPVASGPNMAPDMTPKEIARSAGRIFAKLIPPSWAIRSQEKPGGLRH